MNVRGRLAWTAIFGAAFGWVEAAVVVYLRRIVYPGGFALPLAPLDPSLAIVELVREAATIAMLAAVAMLAGRTRWQRFAAFIVAFGVWDLVYYLGLKLALDWPASLATWDVLFLLPWPWLGPVYAPATVAVLMAIFGSLVMLEEEVRPRRADLVAWLLGAAGALVLLVTWLYDLDAGLRQAAPASYPWPCFAVGCALLVGCGLRFLSRRPVSSGPPPTRSR
jgi:ABC-type tungstate transport system substrate-binding protein